MAANIRINVPRFAPHVILAVDMTSTVKSHEDLPGSRARLMVLPVMGGARAIGRGGACNSDG